MSVPTNVTIEQIPYGTTFPVGQDLMFVISNATEIANPLHLRVKFVAEVHIGEQPVTLSATDDIIGNFKTTPNNAGVGIFNMRNVVENYVKADHQAALFSKYKGSGTSANTPHPIHIIDKFSRNENIVRYLGIQFKVEYFDNDISSSTYQQTVIGGAQNTANNYQIFNGYVKHTDELSLSIGNWGKSWPFNIFGSTSRYITNAPKTQYANSGDYGRLAISTNAQSSFTNANHLKITYYDYDGSAYAGTDSLTLNPANGGYSSWSTKSFKQVLYVGAFPGNLENWSSNYATAVTGGLSHYELKMEDASNTQRMEMFTIYLNCPNTQGYESIRLCWLNQWGAWDYYTFTQKSVRTISTEGSTYQQLGGTWNESKFSINSSKGGKKAFRRNATEKITINTDFVTSNYNVMFEELMNSPEVYMLQGFQTDKTFSALNQYVTPVRMLTSSFVKKTKANDYLIQYTFEVEKSKTLRTQTV